MTIIDLAQQNGLNPIWVAGTNGGEFHSACPVCGGTDRFFMQPYRKMNNCMGSYCCRRCGISGNAINFAREFLNYSFRDAVTAVNGTFDDSFRFNSFSVQLPATLKKPPVFWIHQAHEFVIQAQKNLLQKNEILLYLEQRGLPLEAVMRYSLGWQDTGNGYSRTTWGLSEEINANTQQLKSLWIPKGLVIPTLTANNEIVRLKVRRFDWHINDKFPKYVAITGSMNGLNIIGNTKHKTIVVVESELDAFALDHVAGDFVCAVAVGSNIKNPDNVTDRLAKNATKLLIAHDNDEAGQRMFTKWKRLYPAAIRYPTPFGKDLGEAITQELDTRSWLQKI